MKAIRYGFHFSMLAVSGVVLWFARNVEFYFPDRVFDFTLTFFGLMGALHAASIVLSLRDRTIIRPITASCFIALATLWSAVTPILGLWCSIVWAPVVHLLPVSPYNAIFLFLAGSILGASGYWVLVRLFWLKSLRRADWLRTIGCCAVGTALSFAVCELLPSTPGVAYAGTMWVALSVSWWIAFSLSLYWSEMRGNEERPAVGLAHVS